jgi:hypothetical protein
MAAFMDTARNTPDIPAFAAAVRMKQIDNKDQQSLL